MKGMELVQVLVDGNVFKSVASFNSVTRMLVIHFTSKWNTFVAYFLVILCHYHSGPWLEFWFISMATA
jgi:hypothetical protein